MKSYKEYISEENLGIHAVSKLVPGVKVINRDTATIDDTSKVSKLTKKLISLGYKSSVDSDVVLLTKQGAKNISISFDDAHTKATIVVG